ncbi:MAG: proline dehydrogenase family protein [Deltaproteobacteria bacterium]|nr:proline dehydrogenase family protein [Deltaproteobacteria bacterium]
MGFFDKTVAASLKFVPRPLVRRVARQYIAGDTLADAVAEAKRLNASGCMVTMDLLGEDTRNIEQTEVATTTYLEMLDTIAREGLDANVSVKPSGIGQTFGEEVFLGHMRTILAKAKEHGNFVRMDMEDSNTTDRTLSAYRALRGEGWDNTGVVLQSMLTRTPADLEAIRPLGPSIRLCKGIYQEPPDRAWQSYEDVNKAFLGLLRAGLSDRGVYLGIATHDDPILHGAEALIAELGLSRDQYEFQMLLGVRPEVRDALVAKGHRVRVYVPWGEDWYAYSVRRLKENPKFAGYITREVLTDPRRLFGEGGDR